MTLSVLIVNWNTRDYLRACLLSLAESLRGIAAEVIVVDNASQDGSAAMVAAEFPAVRLIANSENHGFARGNNQAYAAASGNFIWLLNPDTQTWNAHAEELRAFLCDGDRRGAVASMLVDAATGSPQQSCRTFPSPAALWCEALGLARAFPRSKRYGFYRMSWWNYRSTGRVEQPMASSLLLRHAAIEDAGGLFDEQFPIFFNDVDLCWRLAQKGWEIWYLPLSRVLHHGGASTRQVKPEMIAESHAALARFYRKHYKERLAPALYLATLWLISASGAWRRWRARGR